MPPGIARDGGATGNHPPPNRHGQEHSAIPPNYGYTHSPWSKSVPPKSGPLGPCERDLVWKWVFADGISEMRSQRLREGSTLKDLVRRGQTPGAKAKWWLRQSRGDTPMSQGRRQHPDVEEVRGALPEHLPGERGPASTLTLESQLPALREGPCLWLKTTEFAALHWDGPGQWAQGAVPPVGTRPEDMPRRVSKASCAISLIRTWRNGDGLNEPGRVLPMGWSLSYSARGGPAPKRAPSAPGSHCSRAANPWVSLCRRTPMGMVPVL